MVGNTLGLMGISNSYISCLLPSLFSTQISHYTMSCSLFHNLNEAEVSLLFSLIIHQQHKKILLAQD